MEDRCPNCGTPLSSETIDGQMVVFCVECGVSKPKVTRMATMYSPTETIVHDCRSEDGWPANLQFITVGFRDKEFRELKAYLPADLAVELHQLLDAILRPAGICDLEAENTRLREALSFTTNAIDPAQSDETADWELTDIRWRKRLNEMHAELKRLTRIVDAAIRWRSAELHHAASVLGIRHGDTELLEERKAERTASLQIMLDEYRRNTRKAEPDAEVD